MGDLHIIENTVQSMDVFCTTQEEKHTKITTLSKEKGIHASLTLSTLLLDMAF
jgi:hypothetical protein